MKCKCTVQYQKSIRNIELKPSNIICMDQYITILFKQNCMINFVWFLNLFISWGRSLFNYDLTLRMYQATYCITTMAVFKV